MFDSSYKVYETRKMDVWHCLKDQGVDVYFQSQHKGDCLSPYVVIAYGGGNKLPSFSTSENVINVLCYVPALNPSLIDIFVRQVKQCLKRLYPMIKDTHNDVGDYEDMDVKALTRTLRYTYYCRIENQ